MNESKLGEVAKARTKELVARIRRAMALIESEIEENQGIYPLNKGRVTQAEVCRRASTSPAILQGPTHKNSTLREVKAWLAEINRKVAAGHKKIRRKVTERSDKWEELYLAAAHQSNLYHLQLTTANAKLEARENTIKELEAEIARLQVIQSKGAVVELNAKRKGASPKTSGR